MTDTTPGESAAADLAETCATAEEFHLGATEVDTAKLRALLTNRTELLFLIEKLGQTIAAFPDANNAANIAHARAERDRLAAENATLRRRLDAAQAAPCGHEGTAFEALERLHGRVHRDFNFDANEAAPPTEDEIALRMMDDLVTYADELYMPLVDATRGTQDARQGHQAAPGAVARQFEGGGKGGAGNGAQRGSGDVETQIPGGYSSADAAHCALHGTLADGTFPFRDTIASLKPLTDESGQQ